MDRELSVDGVVNFRDVGGYPTSAGAVVAWRRLFRSGHLSNLSAKEASRLHESLRLRTVIDLRHPEELAANGAGPIDSLRVKRLHLSVIDPALTIAEYRARRMELYGDLSVGADAFLTWLEVGKPAFREYFVTLADATNYPVLVHCSGGKDRTGVAIALALDLLGVPEALIADDFVLSQKHLERFIAPASPERDD